MTALVTGATGFIGRALCRRLRQEGTRVRALARVVPTAVDLWQETLAADLTVSLPTGAMDGIDCVFHLAGKAHALSEIVEDAEEYERVNVGGTRRLVEAADAAGVERFVYFSSVKAMGEETAERLDESHPPQPQTEYGRTKLRAEDLVLGIARRGRHASVLRLPLVYGVGNKGNLYRMAAAIDMGLFPPIPETNNRRSMVHVSNVVDAALLAAERREANGQTFIVSDARDYSTRELFEAIRRALGRPVPRWSVPLFVWRAAGRVGDVASLILGRRSVFDSDAVTKLFGSAWYSSAKIANELGYTPRVGLADALPEIVAWYRAERGRARTSRRLLA